MGFVFYVNLTSYLHSWNYTFTKSNDRNEAQMAILTTPKFFFLIIPWTVFKVGP